MEGFQVFGVHVPTPPYVGRQKNLCHCCPNSGIVQIQCYLPAVLHGAKCAITCSCQCWCGAVRQLLWLQFLKGSWLQLAEWKFLLRLAIFSGSAACGFTSWTMLVNCAAGAELAHCPSTIPGIGPAIICDGQILGWPRVCQPPGMPDLPDFSSRSRLDLRYMSPRIH